MYEMSNEELAVRIAAGETDLIIQLWKQVEKLIKIIAYRYFTANSINGTVRYELDDLIQESYFAVLEAVKLYDPEKEYSFLTYLHFRLKTAFANVAGTRLPKQRNDGFRYSISADVPLNNESEDSFVDMFPSGENIEEAVLDEIYQQELHNALEKSLHTLPERQEEILRSIFYNNISATDIAKKFNCTESNISREKCNALKQLYDERKENGLNEYLEIHTNYHMKSNVKEFQNGGMSVVEKIVLKREQLADEWIKKHYSIKCKKKGRLL